MIVENDILVKFTKYSDNVVYEFKEDVMVFYDNSKLLTKLPIPNLIFTGIKLKFSAIVCLICRDKELNTINYSIWDSYLYLEGKGQIGMFYTTEFIPLDNESKIEKFRANFLEIKEN